MKYRAIKDSAGRFAVNLMCSALEVSASGYYAWLNRPESAQAQANRRLIDRIREVHWRARRAYGSPRITQELRADGHCVGENRVAGLMRAAQIRAKSARQWRATTKSSHRLPVAENTLNRAFNVTQPNRVWAGDISYVWTAEGWLYLAVVLDLYSRAVIGWAMSEQLTTDLAIQALTMALGRRKPKGALLHHSDRGIQYAAGDYQRLLAEHGIDCSMSRKGNCWDNAVVESFFHSLKVELVHHRRYLTRDEARQDIFEWIEVFYNRQRRHSTLGYRSPAEFEAMGKVA
jgi:transposase InsO family protein